MNEAQKRVLVMCEIRFYEASVSSTTFSAVLKQAGWKSNPDFSRASLASLTRLATKLRSLLRSNAI